MAVGMLLCCTALLHAGLQAYDQAKVQDLLRQLCDEAPTILLFLKSVAVIEVGVK
jgi:hypothetical protein